MKTQKFITNMIGYITLIVLAIFILIGNIRNGIALSLLALLLIYLFVKKIKIKRFMLFLIIFSLVTKIVCIFIIKTEPVADFWIMYEAAEKMISGDYSFASSGYFLTWGYQLFHVFYEAFVLNIINSTYFLKILNCIYSTVITVMIYLITKKISNENAARISSLLYSIALYPLYFNTTIGNQQLGLMLMLIGIYIILFKENNIRNLIIAGIIIAISNLERSEGIVYILTIIIFFIIKNKNLKEICKKSIVILLTYFIVLKGSSFILTSTGFNDIGFSNTNIYWKFYSGFNYDSNGKYSGNDEGYFNLSKEKQKEVTIERISEINKWPKLFYEKIKINFLYGDLEETVNRRDINLPDEIKEAAVNYMKLINEIIIVIAFIGMFKNKKITPEIKFFEINLLIYFAVYLLIEVQIRYYFNPEVTIYILSSVGIERILNYINNRKVGMKYAQDK